MRVDWRAVGVVSLLAVFAVGVCGYHPYAEDGGIYVAGVKRVMDPAMYGTHPVFVTEQLRLSAFPFLVAGIARVSHAPLEWLLLALYGASVWTTLYAAWMIAARCTECRAGRFGAVALLACWLTLPIAGTSLMLFDPYLTARSLVLPLTLMALAGAMDAVNQRRSRARSLMTYALIAATVIHPLMGLYGWAVMAAVVIGTGRSRKVRWRGYTAMGVIALAIAAGLQSVAAQDSAAYLVAARTRYYWFLSEWHWYEWLGLVAPLVLLAVFARRGGALARGGLALGLISATVALGFARIGLATHLVARMQPLRCFQLVYVFMILLLGMWVGERMLKDKAWRWVVMMAVLGGAMFFVQRSIYPASAHVEWPGVAPRNAWEQAFLWARANTPKDAVFAMDPHYIQADDAQCFRAIAERDALADYSKDGGEASITPTLTEAWVAGQAAQDGIEVESDAVRKERLKGAGWVVLRVGSGTEWECPYSNEAVKVCRVP